MMKRRKGQERRENMGLISLLWRGLHRSVLLYGFFVANQIDYDYRCKDYQQSGSIEENDYTYTAAV
jgi:hypothetical protein